jgi:phosphoadenosine phosphosulfate reductase
MTALIDKNAIHVSNAVSSATQNTLNDLSMINKNMESWNAEAILSWAIKTYGDKLAFATAFGIEGVVLLHMMSKIPGFDKAFLFNLDTGYQFAETMALREEIKDKLGLDVKLVGAHESVADMEARFGGPIYGTDPDKCCGIRKVAPLKEAIAGYGAWISAIRREQSPQRATAPIIGWDKKFELVKINPLANWTRKQVWAYAMENNVPYNPLFDQNYTSIGCWPCTIPVTEGGDERAGRWAGQVKTECGLHVGSH